MIDLRSAVQVILQESGYRTSLVPVEGLVTVLGFACVFDEVRTLLARWQILETALLTQHAPRLQIAGEKAWNVYCAFLCPEAATQIEQHEIDWIEENQERTRKIAAVGVAGFEELVNALLPVLPLQYQAILSSEDVTERLQKRIATIAPDASTAALDDKVSATEVARLLGAPI